jgi:hypothetical protein
MGYSIAVPVKNNDLKNKMLSFLDKEYKPWSTMDNRWKNDYASHPTDDLDYDNGKCRIGFNYNTAYPERFYIYTILRWMVLKVGKKRKHKSFDTNILYYVYDGCEISPVVIKDTMPVPKDYQWAIVDQYGWKPSNKFDRSIYKKKECDVWDELIKKEVEKLDDLWEKHK